MKWQYCNCMHAVLQALSPFYALRISQLQSPISARTVVAVQLECSGMSCCFVHCSVLNVHSTMFEPVEYDRWFLELLELPDPV